MAQVKVCMESAPEKGEYRSHGNLDHTKGDILPPAPFLSSPNTLTRLLPDESPKSCLTLRPTLHTY